MNIDAEDIVKFVVNTVLFIGLIFFTGWGYSTAWNMMMPTLFNAPEVTMLQAYVAVVTLGLVFARLSPTDPKRPMSYTLGAGYAKVTVILVFAFVIKTFFL